MLFYPGGQAVVEIQSGLAKKEINFKILMNVNEYQFNTPDGEVLKFKCVFEKKPIDSLFNKFEPKRLPDTGHMETYRLSNGNFIVKKFINEDIYLIFDDEDNYKRFVKGKTYWTVYLRFKDNNKIYILYDLYPRATIGLKEQIDKPLDGYISIDEYHPFLLKNKAVVYLRYRTPEFSEGYWYPDINNFENSYNDFEEELKPL